MHIRSAKDIKTPLSSPLGEIVYELVGSTKVSGEAHSHSLAVITLMPGGRSSTHFHLLSEESYYILTGQALIIIDAEEQTLSPGQACLIKPPSKHEIYNPGNQELTFLAVCSPAWSPSDSFPVETV
jgi:mannose-6-phosphate isomerase-like protein (cupin superfamily)